MGDALVKKFFMMTSLCFLLMLSACGESPKNIPENSSSGTAPETASSEAPQEAVSDLVLDTSQDAGHLTVRYLELTRMYSAPGQQSAVSTGDSAVYTSPDGQVMLVDCGNPLGGEEVVAQLQAMGVESIDIVVLSHPHADHIGGFCIVADTFPIGQVYTNGHEYDSGSYRSAMEKIQDLDIPCGTLQAGDEFSFGEDVAVTVYGPEAGATEDVAAGYQDANDCSIAMRMVYGESSFWTSGDLYTTGEQRLVDSYGQAIQSDVAKMDHHSKDTSNCKAYVEALSPKIAVGMFDSVASRTVSMRYLANGAQVYYNCVDGIVRVSTTGDGTYDVQTQRIRDISILPEPSPDGHYTVS